MIAPDSDSMRERLVCIFGPTCVGKSAFALKLAEYYGGEIVGADSLQVYRRMDIGTAKPTPADRSRVPHHLLDVVEPNQPFDASRYQEMAAQAVTSIHKKIKTPFVAGGTGLYIRALLGGLIDGPPADEELRIRLKGEMKERGKGYLHDLLAEKDPRAASVIHPHDGIRIVRALEVLELTGRSIVEYRERHRFQGSRWDVLRIGLRLDRQELYRRIDERVDRMMAAGFLEEVEGLLKSGCNESLKPMQSLGYRHLSAVVGGRISLEEAVRLTKRDTRMYSKRQMTWFSADREAVWLSPDSLAEARTLIDFFLRGKGA